MSMSVHLFGVIFMHMSYIFISAMHMLINDHLNIYTDVDLVFTHHMQNVFTGVSHEEYIKMSENILRFLLDYYSFRPKFLLTANNPHSFTFAYSRLVSFLMGSSCQVKGYIPVT